jgi:hypothetical protein
MSGTLGRVLFDECVPRKLMRELPDVGASHAITEGWAGHRNGMLLRAMVAGGFHTLITVDRNLAFQQNVAASGIAVIVLHAKSNRVPDLIPLIPALLERIASISTGEVAHIGI